MTLEKEKQGKGYAQMKLLQKLLNKPLREKLKYGFPFSRLNLTWLQTAPVPKLVLQFSVFEREWQLLLTCSNAKTPVYLISMLTEIAEIFFTDAVKAWNKKHRYRMNLKTMSSQSSVVIHAGQRRIEITTALVSEFDAGQRINDLMQDFVEKKHHLKMPKDLKRYFHYALPIFAELQTNKFIRYETKGKKMLDNIQPLVHFDKIKSYLTRRIAKEPRLIKCIYCDSDAYVLKDNQHFCFNPSCRVLRVRKKAELA